MVATLNRATDLVLTGSAEARHSTTAIEHVAKFTRDIFKLACGDNLSAPLRMVDRQLAGIATVIDGVQFIFPIEYWFISRNYANSTPAQNIFWGGNLIVSAFDFHDWLAAANLVDLGKHAAALGRDNPILRPVIGFLGGPFIPCTVLVMFVAHAKSALDTIHSDSSSVTDNQRGQAQWQLVYAVVTIAVTVLGMTALANAPIVIGLDLSARVIGFGASLNKVYAP